MIRVAGVIVRGDKAFACVLGRTEAGFYVDMDPTYVTGVETDGILEILEQVIGWGHPEVPTPSLEEQRRRKGPILVAAGVSSWKKLAEGGISYLISWRADAAIELFCSRLDRKGRFEWDPGRTRLFPGETPLREVVEAILEDVSSRDKASS